MPHAGPVLHRHAVEPRRRCRTASRRRPAPRNPSVRLRLDTAAFRLGENRRSTDGFQGRRMSERIPAHGPGAWLGDDRGEKLPTSGTPAFAGSATERARDSLPLGVPVVVPGLRPPPDRRQAGPGAHGSRTSTATTTSTSTWASARSSPATATRRCAPPSRPSSTTGTLFVTPSRVQRRGGRAARRRGTASRCGGSPTPAPRRPWTPSGSPVVSRGGTSSSRSRAATTAITTRS